MPLGPWAIAKRSLRIQIVFSNSSQYHLLNGAMDKAFTFKVEGTGLKSRQALINLFQKKNTTRYFADFLRILRIF